MTAVRNPLAIAGLLLLAVLSLTAVFAPQLAPYDPRALVGAALQPPSAHHLLGTNDVGQDLFSQLVYGARASLTVAAGAASIAVIISVIVGAGSALFGGFIELAAMRVVDVFLALPMLPVSVLVAAFIGGRRENLILLIGLLTWPGPSRILRSQTRTVRQRGFVQSSLGFGAGPAHIMRRHLLPALAPYIVADFVTVAGHAVLLEAGLAFLGLGDPTGVSWGLILNRALAQQGLYFSDLWIWSVLPAGLAITLAVLAFSFLGVGIEPAMNPRWRRTA